MKRRQLVRYAGATFLATFGLGLTSHWQAFQAQTSDSIIVQWLGHSAFLFTGAGQRILVNPFRPTGCTAGYRPVRVVADLVLISSRLFDEGWVDGLPGNPRLLAEAGIYELDPLRIQGILTAHDREGGRRFGNNVIWRWNQAGINIVHMGGAAAPITVEEQILIGRPDVLLLPVGGGPKAYNAQEAVSVIQALNPKLAIPTQYQTAAAEGVASADCLIEPIDEFLTLAQQALPAAQISQGTGDALTVRASALPSTGTKVQVFKYRF
ncbi:MAG: MBL fold metallo-hydrolase [Leptolyngbyaceae cyanobacterium SL_1_1]|nr:MBL fold metallo-hydrolase [Leptolyngbyaceae cyanobacterium RM1_1_2]NJO09345.1 MBL fold metallo-hydrolase [Leptolyngbyaceae cyanobacterium SL_1_1]